MKILVLLSNCAGELDRSEIDIPDNHPDTDEAVNLAASEVIGNWYLSIGDTITITETKNV